MFEHFALKEECLKHSQKYSALKGKKGKNVGCLPALSSQ